MAKAILICGKICSGKTYYATNMMKNHNAVLLSSDELISALFHPNENEYHDKVIEKAHSYLLQKSVEIIKTGADAILDWGFWTRRQRAAICKFYAEHGIQTEWHYMDIDDAEWRRNIEKRNKAVLAGETTDYYADQGLIDKVNKLFEAPCKDEADVWVYSGHTKQA